jgi:hypothetical protein
LREIGSSSGLFGSGQDAGEAVGQRVFEQEVQPVDVDVDAADDP